MDEENNDRKKILQWLKDEAPYGLNIKQISERVFDDPNPNRNRKDFIRRHLKNEPRIEHDGNTRGRNFRYVSTVLDSDFTLKEIANAWVSCKHIYYRGSHGFSHWSSFQNCLMYFFPDIHRFLFWNGEVRPQYTNFNWDYDLSSLRADFMEKHGDEFSKMVRTKEIDFGKEQTPISNDGLKVDTSFITRKQISLNIRSMDDLIINGIRDWILSHNSYDDGEVDYHEPPSYPNLICESLDQVLNDEIAITREIVISLALSLFHYTIIEENPHLKELGDDDYAAAQYYGHI